MEHCKAQAKVRPKDTIAVCVMCGSRVVIMRYNGDAYWFDCRKCGYSSPGRTLQSEAMEDVNWESLVPPKGDTDGN